MGAAKNRHYRTVDILLDRGAHPDMQTLVSLTILIIVSIN